MHENAWSNCCDFNTDVASHLQPHNCLDFLSALKIYINVWSNMYGVPAEKVNFLLIWVDLMWKVTIIVKGVHYRRQVWRFATRLCQIKQDQPRSPPRSPQGSPDQPRADQINPDQARSVQISPGHPRTPQISPGQPRSAEIAPDQLTSGQINPDSPRSLRSVQVSPDQPRST